MITVKVNLKIENLNKLLRQLPDVQRKIANDAKQLGESTYQYVKTLIPVSKLNRPHLRDSFKVQAKHVPGGVLIGLYTEHEYAGYLDLGATIPTRYPKSKQSMRFAFDQIGGDKKTEGDAHFKKVQGFTIKGIHYVDSAQSYMISNVGRYIDLTLQRYLI